MALTLNWLMEQKINDLSFTCLAGEGGLCRRISSINIMDNPDTVPWLKEDELILSTGYIFISTDIYKNIIRSLHRKGCSGLGIKMHRYMESIPEEMIEQANELDFPIFSIPFSMTMEQIINLVYYEMFRGELSESERMTVFYKDILTAALKNHNALQILQKVSRSLSRPVFLTDPDFGTIEYYADPEEDAAVSDFYYEYNPGYLFPEVDRLYLAEQITGRMPVAEHEVVYQEHKYLFSIFPIRQKKNLLGHFVVLNTDVPLSGAQYDLIANLQSVFGIIFMKNQISAEGEEFSQAAFYEQLLSGSLKDPVSIERLCSQYGFDCAAQRICFTVQSPKYRTATALRQKSYLNRILDYILSAADTCRLSVSYTVYCQNIVCFLFRKDAASKDFNSFLPYISKIARKAEKEDENAKIGFSRPLSGPETIFQSYTESLHAIELGGKLHPEKNVFSYAEDINYHILSQNMTSARLYDYYSMVLKPLDDYDANNGTELVMTLSAYLESGQNVSQASKKLYIHRNTMIHRMDQIWEILDASPDDEDRIYLIRTAFYIKKILQI